LRAIAGDGIGSTYEFSNVKRTEFELFTRETYFTDDNVMTIATMDVLLNKSIGHITGQCKLNRSLNSFRWLPIKSAP
jgi:ADP-ribosylglycohydrolase